MSKNESKIEKPINSLLVQLPTSTIHALYIARNLNLGGGDGGKIGWVVARELLM